MTRKRKWPPDIILVEWVDSVSIQGWDNCESRCEDLKDDHLDHMSVGYLIKKTKKWVALTHSIGTGLESVHNTMRIPMCAVKRLSYLKKKDTV